MRNLYIDIIPFLFPYCVSCLPKTIILHRVKGKRPRRSARQLLHDFIRIRGQYTYLLTLDYAYGGSDLDRVSNVNTDTVYWQPQTGARFPAMNALGQM